MVQNEVGQPPVGAAWAKAGKRPVPHPLVCHALDTAAVARLLHSLLLGPRVRAELENGFAPLGDAVSWIVLLCGLHDLGKYSPAFQALRADLAEARLGSDAVADIRWASKRPGIDRTDTPHGLVTTLHMKDLLKGWGAQPEVADSLARVLGAHHGYVPDAAVIREARSRINHHGQAKWAAWRDRMVMELVRTWELPNPGSLPWGEVRITDAAAVGLMALTSVSDWIASDSRYFPYAEGVTDLAAYARKAGEQADAAVQTLNWSPWQPPADTSFARVFPGLDARPVQVVVERLSANRGTPVLLVIEAPTGEGKTKAAFQAVATLVRDLGLAGTYVAMPTRATSNQVLEELEQVLETLGDPSTVKLVHSSAREYRDAQATKRRAASASIQPTAVSADGEDDSDAGAREWFVRKKSLLDSLAVGTVDQVQKAVIRSGHVFVRLTALSNKVVVFDEVHAYDTYMSTMLDWLLTWLGRLGVPVVLLSATLPSGRRQQLMAAWRAGAANAGHPGGGIELPGPNAGLPGLQSPPDQAPYPRVTLVEPGQPQPEVTPAEVSALNSGRIVRLEHVPDGDELVNWLLEGVRGGGCAALICNLVASRAIHFYEQLKEAVADLPDAERPKLISFTREVEGTERETLEDWLRQAFGPGGSRPHAIVVASQVLEQSLDLDFDVMITDLAPVDLMIQRAGRLHRHDLGRPRGTPVLGITGVTDTAGGPTFPQWIHNVYAPWLLLRTWAVLRERTAIHSPEDVPELVELVYGPADAVPCPAGWEEQWWRAAKRFRRTDDNQRYDAATVYPPPPGDNVEDWQALTARPKSTRRTRWRRGGRDRT